KSATHNARTIREQAGLLAAVIVAERIHNEIDELFEPASRQYGVALEEGVRRDLRDSAVALDTILEAYINDRRASFTSEIRAKLAKLLPAQAPTDEMPDLTTIAEGLVNIANLLGHAHDDLPDYSDDSLPSPQRIVTPHSSKFLVRFSARHTIAMTLAFVT